MTRALLALFMLASFRDLIGQRSIAHTVGIELVDRFGFSDDHQSSQTIHEVVAVSPRMNKFFVDARFAWIPLVAENDRSTNFCRCLEVHLFVTGCRYLHVSFISYHIGHQVNRRYPFDKLYGDRSIASGKTRASFECLFL